MRVANGYSCSVFGMRRGFCNAALDSSSAIRWNNVLNDESNATVRGLERIFGVAQFLVRITANLGNLVGAKAMLLHQAPGGIGAIGREFPVGIDRRSRIRFRVGVAFDRDFVRVSGRVLRPAWPASP